MKHKSIKRERGGGGRLGEFFWETVTDPHEYRVARDGIYTHHKLTTTSPPNQKPQLNPVLMRSASRSPHTRGPPAQQYALKGCRREQVALDAIKS